MVRNDRARERKVTVGWGTIPIHAPRINDKHVRPDTTETAVDQLDAVLRPPGRLVRACAAHRPGVAKLRRQLRPRDNLMPDATPSLPISGSVGMSRRLRLPTGLLLGDLSNNRLAPGVVI
ncbi:hypothetical protein AYO39_01420 [Actinobacteria bacterium SCGC AG-212-D09]|nr:hypothetical protein AYO39_01420 [Actinobacteria bacterium SCGC AG-212-D09]